jgi:glycosyltransferase involved in cell wall biosynthesis
VRLLLVNSAWPPAWGGGEKWFMEAAVRFSAFGHAVRLVGRPASRLLHTARERNVDAIETPFGGDFDPRAIARARAIIAAFAPEAVLVNFNKEAYHFGFAARKLGVPVIARHGFPLWKARMHHRMLAQKLLAGVIVNASVLWDNYRALGIAPRYVAVIPNGVDIVAQKRGELRRRFGIGEHQRLVLAAGRLESQKRLDRVIDVAAQLLPDHPDLTCLIAGEGPLQNDLENLIRARGLENHVRLAGFIEDFAEVCGAADLFLLTSDQEGTPNALLEAMAAGVPCLSFAVGSVPQIFTDDLANNLIPSGNIAAMITRARKLLDDPATRQEIGAQMCARVASDYTMDASLHRYETVFQDIIAVTT